MSQAQFYSAPLGEQTGERGWWGRLIDSVVARREDAMEYQLPSDSLFAGTWDRAAESVADVPEGVKMRIREEAVLDTFNRLEASLRLLLYATTPDKEPPTADRCRQILNVWRYELEHRVKLTPDTYCGAVQRYEPDMAAAYTIDGRCEPGDLLRIRVPCWRMFDRVVIRGEAEAAGLSEAQLPAGVRVEPCGADAAAKDDEPTAPEASAEGAG